MNRKMIRFALAGKCGGLASSGLDALAPAARTLEAKSSESNPASPSRPKPLANRRKTWRRVMGFISVHINKFVRAEQHLAILLPGVHDCDGFAVGLVH